LNCSDFIFSARLFMALRFLAGDFFMAVPFPRVRC
jgi:hypothetical protein